MTPHTPQLNGVIERKFAVIKERALGMLLDAKINDTAHKFCRKKQFTCANTCKKV